MTTTPPTPSPRQCPTAPRGWSGQEARRWSGLATHHQDGLGVAFLRADEAIGLLYWAWNWNQLGEDTPLGATCCPGFVVTEEGVLLNPALFGKFGELELELEDIGGHPELRGDGYLLGRARPLHLLSDEAILWWLEVGAEVISGLCDFESQPEPYIPWEKPYRMTRKVCVWCELYVPDLASRCVGCQEKIAARAAETPTVPPEKVAPAGGGAAQTPEVCTGGVVTEEPPTPRVLTSADQDYYEALGWMAWPRPEAWEENRNSYLALVVEALTVLTAVDEWGQVSGPGELDVALHPGLLTVDGVPYLAPLLLEEGREVGVTQVSWSGRNMLELTDGGRWLGVARPLEDLGCDALDHWLLDGSDIVNEYRDVAVWPPFDKAGLVE